MSVVPNSSTPSPVVRDAYGFEVNKEYVPLFSTYSGIWAEEEEQRMEQWMAFIAAQTEAAQLSARRSNSGGSSSSTGGSSGAANGATLQRASSGTLNGMLSSTIMNQREILEPLVEGGVPRDMRGAAWKAFLGIEERKIPGYYRALVERSLGELSDRPVISPDDVKQRCASVDLDAPLPHCSLHHSHAAAAAAAATSGAEEPAAATTTGHSSTGVGAASAHAHAPFANGGSPTSASTSAGSCAMCRLPGSLRTWKINGADWLTQIEKDLHRTFPGHERMDRDGRIELRRILAAYSLHNGQVGYCQGMNFVAGCLLLFLTSEEDVFYCLATIVEELLPGYYSMAMVAPQVDQRVFRRLVRDHFPALTTHLETLGVDVSCVFAQWFLCCFVNYLPLHSCLRVWDLVFYERSAAPLFRAALALVQIYSGALASTDDLLDACELLQSMAPITFDGSRLLAVACRDFRDVTLENVQRLHNEYLPQVLQELDRLGKRPLRTPTPVSAAASAAGVALAAGKQASSTAAGGANAQAASALGGANGNRVDVPPGAASGAPGPSPSPGMEAGSWPSVAGGTTSEDPAADMSDAETPAYGYMPLPVEAGGDNDAGSEHSSYCHEFGSLGTSGMIFGSPLHVLHPRLTSQDSAGQFAVQSETPRDPGYTAAAGTSTVADGGFEGTTAARPQPGALLQPVSGVDAALAEEPELQPEAASSTAAGTADADNVPWYKSWKRPDKPESRSSSPDKPGLLARLQESLLPDRDRGRDAADGGSGKDEPTGSSSKDGADRSASPLLEAINGRKLPNKPRPGRAVSQALLIAATPSSRHTSLDLSNGASAVDASSSTAAVGRLSREASRLGSVSRRRGSGNGDALESVQSGWVDLGEPQPEPEARPDPMEKLRSMFGVEELKTDWQRTRRSISFARRSPEREQAAASSSVEAAAGLLAEAKRATALDSDPLGDGAVRSLDRAPCSSGPLSRYNSGPGEAPPPAPGAPLPYPGTDGRLFTAPSMPSSGPSAAQSRRTSDTGSLGPEALQQLASAVTILESELKRALAQRDEAESALDKFNSIIEMMSQRNDGLLVYAADKERMCNALTDKLNRVLMQLEAQDTEIGVKDDLIKELEREVLAAGGCPPSGGAAAPRTTAAEASSSSKAAAAATASGSNSSGFLGSLPRQGSPTKEMFGVGGAGSSTDAGDDNKLAKLYLGLRSTFTKRKEGGPLGMGAGGGLTAIAPED